MGRCRKKWGVSPCLSRRKCKSAGMVGDDPETGTPQHGSGEEVWESWEARQKFRDCLCHPHGLGISPDVLCIASQCPEISPDFLAIVRNDAPGFDVMIRVGW